MFIAHLPAGYLITQIVVARCKLHDKASRYAIIIGLTGSVFPDIDLLYFYTIDLRQHHHHSYWTHIPLFWLASLALFFLALKLMGKSSYALLLLIFGLNVFVHLMLDTVVGDIWWLYPFIDRPFSMFFVPAQYQPWQLNFLLHWSFALELILLCAAYYRFVRRK